MSGQCKETVQSKGATTHIQQANKAQLGKMIWNDVVVKPERGVMLSQDRMTHCSQTTKDPHLGLLEFTVFYHIFLVTSSLSISLSLSHLFPITANRPSTYYNLQEGQVLSDLVPKSYIQVLSGPVVCHQLSHQSCHEPSTVLVRQMPPVGITFRPRSLYHGESNHIQTSLGR